MKNRIKSFWQKICTIYEEFSTIFWVTNGLIIAKIFMRPTNWH